MAGFFELSFDLGSLDAQGAEATAFACGAIAVTFVDAREDTAGQPTAQVLEPAPGEMPLWPATRVKCLFASAAAHEPDAEATVAAALAATLGIDVLRIETQSLADRAWEREWLKDFHAMRFGRRLWVCPQHERVSSPDAVIVSLDPGLAFGTGSHASTALCLEWLDAHLTGPPASAEHSEGSTAQGLDAHLQELPRARVIDYGCGSGVLGIAAARLGAAEVHAFDIDPQALIATADNASANEVQVRLRVHADAAALPCGTDVLLANILAAPLCFLARRFAALVRPGGWVVLAGLMAHEVAEVTAAYSACFDVVRFGERDGWACLTGRRR